MSPRGAARLAWSISAVTAVLLAAAVILILSADSRVEDDSAGGSLDELGVLTAFSIIPLTAGLAILKYRLYEFDAVGPGSDLAVAGSTLVSEIVQPEHVSLWLRS